MPSPVSRRTPVGRVLVAVLVAVLLAGACSSDDQVPSGATTTPPTAQGGADGTTGTSSVETADTSEIEWTDDDGEWESGTLAVPLDHEDPAGSTIDIALVRRRADDPDRRIGVLLLNPGGPGASGIDFTLLTSLLFDDEILGRFDLIGFDPRGVGRSAPVTCGDAEFLDEYTAIDPVPDSAEETAEAEDLVGQFAENCEAESGDLLPDLDTVSTARDMDLIREALGEEQINYLGFSYGTYLGATYLELFGDRVRAAVLDGAYSRSITPEELTEGQAVGFEGTLDAFFERCRAGGCAFARKGDPAATFDALLERIDADPLPTDDGDGRVLTVGLAWTGILQALYTEMLWFSLDRALAAALSGDGTPLLSLADQYNGRDLSGHYANDDAAFVAISCMDDPPPDPDAESELRTRVVAAAPRVGPVFVTLAGPCDVWPVEADPPTGPFSAPDAPPVLVVATTGDPATPYEWGVRLADELETSTLLTVEGDTHTAYFQGNSCVDGAVDSYLLDLRVPAEGARC